MESLILEDSKQDLFQKKLSVSGNTWVLKEKDQDLIRNLVQKYNLPFVAAELIVGRGITLSDIELFLNPSLKYTLPDPSCFLDMDKAAERAAQAVINNEKITIFGDYDVDGATSSALLKRFFRMAGIETSIFIPDRIQDGYGPSKKIFTELHNQGTKLTITVDCGTAAKEALEAAKEMGLDVIVIDHHLGTDINPPAYALVNPNRQDENTIYKHLAAVGMSFLFAVAINRNLREKGWYKTRNEPNLINLLDLVALGTVCDVVPLTGINRAFVSQGLRIIKARQNVGLTQLIESAGISSTIGVYHLGFIIGPRINAGGRVGKSSLGAELLSTEDPVRAKAIAAELEKLNSERKTIEALIFEKAKEQAESQKNNPMLIVKSENWHQGIIGIVCSRLKEEYKKPVFIISIENGIGKASGRSIPGIDIGTAITEAKMLGILLSGGGHAMAAGFSMQENKINDFSDFIFKKLSNAHELSLAQRELSIDATINLSAINNELIENIHKIGPFGAGHAEPMFVLPNINIIKTFNVGQNHIKCILTENKTNSGLKETTIEAVSFRKNGTAFGESLIKSQHKNIHVAGYIRQNEWKGNKKAELIIEDFMLAG